MSEEIKKNGQDAELNLEELDKVSGGASSVPGPACPKCGSENTFDIYQAHMCFCNNCGHVW